MIAKIENDIWFDTEKLNIIKGEENLHKYKENYDLFPDAKENKKDTKEFPVVTFLSSTLCNLKCTYCYAGQGTYNHVSCMNTFTFENYVKTYEKIKEEFGGIKLISFFGGEPLLDFPAIKQFVEYLYANYDESQIPVLTIGSNGTIMNDEIKEFILKYHISLGTSLDGVKQHNDICRFGDGIPSAYDKTLSTIQTLGNNNVDIGVQFTFNRNHLVSYKSGDVVKWANEFENMPIKFYEVVAASTDDPLSRIDLDDEKINENIRLLSRELAEHCLDSLTHDEQVIMPTIFAYMIYNLSKRRKSNHCGAGHNITVTPDMTVYPCHFIASDKKNGVPCQDGLVESIKNAESFNRMKNMRRCQKSKCSECIAKNICSVFCKGMCYSGAELPEERCIMMKEFLSATIRFMATKYHDNEENVVKSVKNIIHAKAATIND